MKRHLLFLSFLPLSSFVCAQQLSVDAGNDTVLCAEFGQAVQFNLSPMINGGTPPYTYEWSIDSRSLVEVPSGLSYDLPVAPFSEWSSPLLASYVLSEVDIEAPSFYAINNIFPEVDVILTVTDSALNSASDTIRIGVGGFLSELLAYFFIPDSPKLGDTVTFQGGYHHSNYLPLKSFEWFPKTNDMITSPYEATVDVVLSDADFSYHSIYMEAKDFYACSYKMKPYDDTQPPLSVEDLKSVASSSIVVLPTINSVLMTSSGLNMKSVRVFDMTGKLTEQIGEVNQTIAVVEMPISGAYFVKIELDDGSMQQHKFVMP